jgi:hypothetical protein
MKAAIDQLTLVVKKAEEVIANHITGVTKLLGDHGSYFVSARPALASVPDGKITGGDGIGDAD